MIADPHELQRLRYTPGQDLLSRDFRDQAAFDEQLRWWHNRALHGAFGVRYGLTVRLVSGASELTVEIDGGLAYDCFGRELILPAPRSLQVPTGPREIEPRVLVIRYRGDGGSPSSHELAGVCCGGTAPRGADLAWLPARRLRPADGVPLARVVYDRGEPSPDMEFHPPVARPLARPRLGRGGTVAGGTEWEIWDLGAKQGVVLGLQVSINTQAAGFTEPPCYFAWLQGGIESRPDADGRRFLLPLYSHIAAESLTGFSFRVLTFGTRDIRNPILSSARRQLTVCWLGIQMRSDEDVLPEVIHGHP